MSNTVYTNDKEACSSLLILVPCFIKHVELRINSGVGLGQVASYSRLKRGIVRVTPDTKFSKYIPTLPPFYILERYIL
jgi:hypothetical protein